MVKNLHTIDELCEKCRISKGMVHKLRRAGMPHITIGRCIRYSMEDVDAWIADVQDKQGGYDPVREHEREALLEDMNGASLTELREEFEI